MKYVNRYFNLYSKASLFLVDVGSGLETRVRLGLGEGGTEHCFLPTYLLLFWVPPVLDAREGHTGERSSLKWWVQLPSDVEAIWGQMYNCCSLDFPIRGSSHFLDR